MRLVAEIILLVLLIATKTSLCMDHYKHEAHTIMKRMAEGDNAFDGYDVATVHVVEDHGERGRRLVKRDLSEMGNMLPGIGGERTVQLALASGSTVNLGLTPAGIVDHDTVLSFQTARRSMGGSLARVDCYSYGHVEDSSGMGWAAVSHCDGLFGFANSGGFEYFLHPVESRRSKRDTREDEQYDVHVMWRRSVNNENASNKSGDLIGSVEDCAVQEVYDGVAGRVRREAENRENATGFVIELAMFSDARYCQQLQSLYPGREDDFLLTRLAGVQALFSNREKIGYDVKIKVKLLEYWHTDPENYTFTEKFSTNLISFCSITTKKYSFDVHALNTGIVDWNDGLIGLAHVGGACTGSRCMIVKGTNLESYRGYAHELGHILGLSHHTSCPSELSEEGGFMGGGSPYNFSPCMKFQLDKYLATSRSDCLFTETSTSTAPEEFNVVPSLFPGQVKSPDSFCQLLAGPDYRYVPNERSPGTAACKWFFCFNDNEQSPEYLRSRFFWAPMGFFCQTEAFCDVDKTCKPWERGRMSLKPETLRSLVTLPQWSEWSTEFSQCSRSCGTGVRSRRRVCQYTSYALAPYCPGVAYKPEFCNTQPCPGTPMTLSEVRNAMGAEVCSRFLAANVRLRKTKSYLPRFSPVTVLDVGPNLEYYRSKSCVMKCARRYNAKGDADAILPDGAPCLENRRTVYDLDRLNITIRCVGGHCLEMTNCPDILQKKDDCGICGGDDTRCVKLNFESAYNVPRKGRGFLTEIPQCSKNIDVRSDPKKNSGVIIELWSKDERNIIGHNGQYHWADNQEINLEFAGTTWTFRQKDGYLRAPGPLMEGVKIKYSRLGLPMNIMTINYAKSA